MSSDRYNATEQPTIRRLNKAREEGQVARSNDLSSVLFLIVAVGVSIAWAPRLLLICKNILVDSLSFSKSNPQVALETTGWLLVEFLVVPCFVLFVGAIFAALLQVGGLFSPKIVMIRLSRLSAGQKGMFSTRSRMTLLFSMSKLVFSVLAALLVILHYQDELFALGANESIMESVSSIVLICSQTVFAALSVLFILGICDYCWQRYAWKNELRMTRQEVIEEHREHSGRSVETRRRSWWLAKKTTGVVVPSLIIVGNKLAVALRWNASTMTAPIVLDVLRGDSMLSKLEQLNNDGIAIIENNVLAQKIMHGSDVGLGIPSFLHGEIASLLITSKRDIR